MQSRRPHPLIRGLRETCERRHLFTPGARVLVAVSGGPDSTALLHGLHSVAPELGLELAVGHVEHGLRGSESLSDAAYARRTAESLELPFLQRTLNPPSEPLPHRESTQMWARAARYQALGDMCSEWSATHLATAHTRDDQAETVLLRVLQGTGPDALAGIPYVGAVGLPANWSLPVVRPLLDCSRAQVESYCEELGLEPRQDATNASPHYRRNRLRLELMPLLRERMNPELDTALVRLAELAREDGLLLRTLAGAAWQKAMVDSGDPLLTVQDTGRWPPELALQRRLVHRLLTTAAPDHAPHFADVERVLEHLGGPDWSTEVHPRMRVELRSGHLSVRRRAPDASP